MKPKMHDHFGLDHTRERYAEKYSGIKEEIQGEFRKLSQARKEETSSNNRLHIVSALVIGGPASVAGTERAIN